MSDLNEQGKVPVKKLMHWLNVDAIGLREGKVSLPTEETIQPKQKKPTSYYREPDTIEEDLSSDILDNKHLPKELKAIIHEALVHAKSLINCLAEAKKLG